VYPRCAADGPPGSHPPANRAGSPRWHMPSARAKRRGQRGPARASKTGPSAPLYQVFGVSNLVVVGVKKIKLFSLSLSPRCVCVCVKRLCCAPAPVAGCWVAGQPAPPHTHTTPQQAPKRKKKKKEKSTTPAVRVSSPTTLLVRAHTCLTSLIGREAVFPRGYDRRC
jgi:hypothetical protein